MQALGLIETKGLLAAIESADAMLKAADVKLLEKTIVGGGLVSITISGDVGAVKAAIDAGGAAVRNINSALLVSEHVIPRPHQDLNNMVLLTNIESEEEVIVETIEEELARISTEVEVTVGEIKEVTASRINEEETASEINEEETTEITTDAEIVADHDLAVKNIESKEFMSEIISKPLQINLSECHKKEAIDKIVLENGSEEAIQVLGKFKVIELRNLAREYKNFGIAGRKISKADKGLLLTEFRKYYMHN